MTTVDIVMEELSDLCRRGYSSECAVNILKIAAMRDLAEAGEKVAESIESSQEIYVADATEKLANAIDRAADIFADVSGK